MNALKFLASLLLFMLCIQSAHAKKSQKEEDLDSLREDKKTLTKAKDKLARDQRDLKTLKDAQTGKSALPENLAGDCYTQCRPSSEGGSCPDDIFHNAHIIVGTSVKWDSVGKKFVASGELDRQVSAFQNAPAGQTVCEQVHNVLSKTTSQINPSGHLTCETAANACKYVHLPKDISSKQGDVEEDQVTISTLEAEIRSLKEDTEDGCADCGTAYAQREPTKAESTAMVLGSIYPYFSTGLSGYLKASAQNKYYSAYNNYLTQCTTIGVPCHGPSYAGVSGGLSTGITGATSIYGTYTGTSGTYTGTSGVYTGTAGIYTGSSGIYTGTSGIYSGLYSGGIASGIAGISTASSYSGYSGIYGTSAYTGGIYGTSAYGTGAYASSLYGASAYSQYGALYNQSLASQMYSTSSAAAAAQSSMLAQQQLYSAEQRYSQVQQSSGSYYGSIYGSSTATGAYSGLYGSLFGGTSTGGF